MNCENFNDVLKSKLEKYTNNSLKVLNNLLSSNYNWIIPHFSFFFLKKTYNCITIR